MKVQYFGDVNDYRKFALLRALASEAGFKIGVCWMLTPDDEGPDGGERRYLHRPGAWRAFDPALFDALAKADKEGPAADFARIEQGDVIPGAAYFNDPVPDDCEERSAFHKHCMAALADVELAFFDPDNGLEVTSIPKGRKRSSKFVFLDELADHYRAGRSLLVYQHFPRHMTRSELIKAKCEALMDRAPDSSIWAFETAHVVFLLAARPEHSGRVEKVTAAIGTRGWTPGLFTGARRVEAL